MKKWESKMGAAFLDRQDEPILTIGDEVYSRRRMINELKIAHFGAAARLDRVLRYFNPKGVAELSRRMKFGDLIDIKGVGLTTVYVWMKVLERAGKDPEVWVDSEFNIPTLLSERTFNFARYARLWFANGDLETKRSILASLGSNLILKDQQLNISLQKPFELILERRNSCEEEVARLEPEVTPANTDDLDDFDEKIPLVSG